MRYYKQVESGYITAIGTGDGGGIEITEQGYSDLMSIIISKPPRTENTDYRLKTDMTWEEYELPPEPQDEDIDNEEAVDMIFGGDA